MPAIVSEDIEILGGLTISLQKQEIKGIVDFEEGEVLKILGYAFDRQDFFFEGFIPAFMAPAFNPFFIPLKKPARSTRHIGHSPCQSGYSWGALGIGNSLICFQGV